MTPAHPTDAGQDTPGRRPSRSRSGVRLVLVATLVALAVLGAGAALLTARVDRLALDLHPGPGRTWLLVGLDSRAELPAGATTAEFGTPEQVPGARADVVLVVHEERGRTRTLSVPRDLLVGTTWHRSRLATSWLDDPQATVDALCDLGIPTDHVVTVDLAGFTAVVDAAGGLDLDVPQPVRDPAAGLELPRSGPQHVDGLTALALVRSRHPENLVGGQWVPAPVDPDGRASAAGTVLTALLGAVRSDGWQPGRLHEVAWAASGALSVDRGTSVPDLASLAGTDLSGIEVLPTGVEGTSGLRRPPTEETAAALADAGLSCSR
ncbi:LCP family protein [Geodermatophilus sp. CPCC 206100]|uniref:LCP family protein n=1 Tax=Geodermatophilus sp. CPCC 206100 TaxID=3020054 RepID=UPI003AFFBED2